MTFGEKIQALRKSRGWSQEQLAEQINVSRQALSKWENGTAIPDTNNVVQLAKLFGVTTDYLLVEEIGSAAVIERVQQQNDERLRQRGRTMGFLIGDFIIAVAVLGLLAIGIASSIVPLYEAYSYYPGLEFLVRFPLFLEKFNLEWLPLLLVGFLWIGIMIILKGANRRYAFASGVVVIIGVVCCLWFHLPWWCAALWLCLYLCDVRINVKNNKRS